MVHAVYALLPGVGPWKAGILGPPLIGVHTWILLTLGGRWDRFLTEKRIEARLLQALEIAMKAFVVGHTCLDCGHVHPGGRTKEEEQPPHGVN